MRLFHSSTRALAALTLLAFASSAHAGLAPTDEFLNQQRQESSRDGRARIVRILEQEQVRKKLEENGVSPSEAIARVSSLSDREVAELNHRIDQLPAGGDAFGVLLGSAVFVFVVLLVTDILCFTKVFPFTRCAKGTKSGKH